MEEFRGKLEKISADLEAKKSAPDFFALLRLFENADPKAPRIGYAKRPAQENIRIGEAPHLNFEASDVASVSAADGLVKENFLGLLGPNAPMPLDFSEYVYQRAHNERDTTWEAFLNIIHHRFATLFYRAWSQNEQSISFDREKDDRLSSIVRSLSGISPDIAFTGRDFRHAPELLASFSRHYGASVKTRWGLEDMLKTIFKFPLEVKDFCAGHYTIPPESRNELCRAEVSTLGVNMQLGKMYIRMTQRFEIIMGPVPYGTYQKFIDNREGVNLMREAVNFYLDRPLDWTLVVKIKSMTIPLMRLGFNWDAEDEEDEDAAQLGYASWLGSLDTDETELRIGGRD